MGRQKKAQKCAFFVGLNIDMISDVKFSGLFVPRPLSPVGTAQGYYQESGIKFIVPVNKQPVKL
jgi:hypothetical protein